MEFEAVIGLEIHIELNCPTKLFCDCPNRPGDEPNRNTCPTCLWFPGIPRLSQAALRKRQLCASGWVRSSSPEARLIKRCITIPISLKATSCRRPISRFHAAAASMLPTKTAN